MSVDLDHAPEACCGAPAVFKATHEVLSTFVVISSRRGRSNSTQMGKQENGAIGGEPADPGGRSTSDSVRQLRQMKHHLRRLHLHSGMLQRTKNAPFRHPLLKLQAVPRGGLFLCCVPETAHRHGHSPIARIKLFALCADMGSARFTYLIDLDRKAADAWVKCEGYGHEATIPTVILFKFFSPTTPLDKAGLRLVCSRCGQKGHRLIPVPQSNAKPFRLKRSDASS